MVTKRVFGRTLAVLMLSSSVLFLSGCLGDAVSKFAGGTSSKEKKNIPSTVQASAGGSSAIADATLAGPAVAEKAAPPEALDTDEPLRKNANMYRADRARDPFMSLVEGESEMDANSLDLSVVKLVGIVVNGDNPFGIVEDAEGTSYVLHKGDRVKNGRVTEINEEMLVAAQTLLGHTVTVQLKLQERKDARNG